MFRDFFSKIFTNLSWGIGGAGCPYWFFGDEKSADKDLKKHFTIV